MASKKFEKGSEEWMMFQDFYALTQELWISDNTREYFDCVAEKIQAFAEKYNHRFATELALALNDYIASQK